jgi:16S rRNA (guanine527-N7)-methyltransferase
MTEKEFTEKLKDLNITCTKAELDQLNQYFELLIEWNNKINLTAITEKKDVYLKHFYDSLTITSVIDLSKVDSLCDVGTGAGFPGIVLKIFFPHIKLTLVDALNKRIKFLTLVCQKLGLSNVECVHARVEEYAKDNRERYDVVTARAVSKLNILLEYCIPLVKEKKYFVAMKGKEKEIDICSHALKELNASIVDIVEIELLNNAGVRNLIKIEKQEKTNSKYPRKYAEMKKKPL